MINPQIAPKAPAPNPIYPEGRPGRRWHLTPWKRTEATALLDDLSGNLGEDEEGEEGDTTRLDIINNLITQAGNVYGNQRGYFGAGGVVPRPRPGQMVPNTGMVAGMSTNTLLLLGAAALGVFILAKK